jgi:uncharacterized protein YutE (UPF0331/DUF86 family)
MDNFKEEVLAELENIDRVVSEAGKIQDVIKLSTLELSGAATLLHNFYNGAENVLKRIVLNRGMQLFEGPAWHRELLCSACESGIISESLKGLLGRYLAFRHFFIHGYALDLRPDRMALLVKELPSVYQQFRAEIGFPFT